MKCTLAIATLALAGCSSLTNESFDNIEASRYSDIAAIAQSATASCKDVNAIRAYSLVLKTQAETAAHYSSVKTTNDRAATAGQIVYQFTVDLNTRYQNGDPSEAYCKLKLGIIEQAADIVARSISKKETKSPFAIP